MADEANQAPATPATPPPAAPQAPAPPAAQPSDVSAALARALAEVERLRPFESAATSARTELEAAKATAEAAKATARFHAISRRLPQHLPAETRELIAHGVLAKLGPFAVDLAKLDATTPQQIEEAIAAAKLPAAPAQTAAALVQPVTLTPSPATSSPAAPAKPGRIDGWLHRKPETTAAQEIRQLAAAITAAKGG